MSFPESSYILKNDNTLWGCGWNDYGQLGLGDKTNRTTFTQITTNTDNIKSIYCGYRHFFILKNDGTLWGCGYNNYGQLGLGDTTNRTILTQITTNTDNIKSIYCGVDHTFILKNNNTLWGCGKNDSGQLGLGDKNNRYTFTQITTNINNIKSVYCGDHHAFVLKNDGTLWGSGDNQYGQLGLGDIPNKSTFTQITTNTDNIKSIYCGGTHTIILKNDGTLWGCGWNKDGQLGLGDKDNRTTFTIIGINSGNIKEIYSSGDHTIILKNDNTLWTCGYNDYGSLGLGDTNDRYIFTQITNNVDNVKLIWCGGHHTLILKNDGTLWGCGYNIVGELGLGDKTHRYTLTQITANVDNIKSFTNDYLNIPSTIKIYDSKIGYTETLDINNFRNIPVDKFEKLKALYEKPDNTILNCIVSFDKKQTWKTFNGNSWTTVSDTSGTNMIVNCMGIETLNNLNKSKLIQGGFTGDLDFKIVMKTNDENKTPSVTKIYIEYK